LPDHSQWTGGELSLGPSTPPLLERADYKQARCGRSAEGER
jgi:hypothetical protein